jgi:glutathione S-transferase
MLALYTTASSANGRKPLAVARHLGLNLDVHLIDVYRGEGQSAAYRKLNPLGKIPTLVDDGFVLRESNAILVHLAEAHGNFALSSRDARRRATILQWMFWEAAHWQPVLTRILSPRVGQMLFSPGATEVAPVAWDDAEVGRLLAVLESALQAYPFVCGEEPTIADFSLGGMTTYFHAAWFPSAEHLAIASWIDRMERIPAWSSTLVEPWSTA